MRISPALCLAAVLLPAPALPENQHQPYAGLQTRDIAALSSQDIAELEAGRGWGLALAAELNGYPGPTHVLELADQLQLSGDQIAQVTQIFGAMQADAKAAGAQMIEAERALDRAFRSGDVTPDQLSRLVRRAAAARGHLRLQHLARHLETRAVLSQEQILRYQVLRGYAADPCASVPDGHDPQMWRRHNGCPAQPPTQDN